MPGIALRFAHASNLRIDAPLRGVGSLPEPARRIAEDAPFTAWERVVEACIDRDVAFLLLTPRTVAGELTPFHGRMLANGFRQLHEFEIPVYWSLAPGESLNESWLAELPDNVTLLSDLNGTATLIREGRVVATLGWSQTGGTALPADRLQPAGIADAALRIRVADEAGTIDVLPDSGNGEGLSGGAAGSYVACWGGARDTSRQVGPDLWVDPGSTCGLTADEPAGGGLHILEWDGRCISGRLRVPTAPVRWQRSLQLITPETTHEDLVERLQLALLEQEPAPGEDLWIIDWQIAGSGPEFEGLHSGSTQQELETAVESVLGRGERRQRIHRWNLRRRGTNPGDDVSRRLQAWLAERAESECASLSNEVGVALRHAAVQDDAERLLAEWLTTSDR